VVRVHPLAGAEATAESAQQHLQKWCSRPPFIVQSHFWRRLAADGLTPDEFLQAVACKDQTLARLCRPPVWLVRLFDALGADLCGPLLPGRSEEPAMTLVQALSPLVRPQLVGLRGRLSRLQSVVPCDAVALERGLLRPLAERLRGTSIRTLVTELHIARLHGRLTGRTPEERFQDFGRRLGEPALLLSLLEEYPVLARQLVTQIDHWKAAADEFLERLESDWQLLCGRFGISGRVVGLTGGLGDSHCGGRTVMIVECDCGSRLVYKPRSLAVDVHFQKLLVWLNERGATPSFQTLELIDRGEYGWSEFVAPADCETPAQVERFYRRMGGYLALLYALEATDFHFENLLACGEHPFLIDLETLFQPRVEPTLDPVDRLDFQAVEQSVLRVGLLPQRLLAGEDTVGVDLSGLVAEPGQPTPRPVMEFEAPGTDRMRVVYRQTTTRGGRNRPTLGGQPVHVLGYSEAVATGFTAMYRLLQSHREALVAKDGPLVRFAEDPVRVLLRPTFVYASLLNTSFHPQLLQDDLPRQRHFDRLWVGIELRPALARVIPLEIAALRAGDIPYFSTRPDSRHLWSPTGEKLADWFTVSGLDRSRQQILRLAEEDLQRQLWFVRASIATLAMSSRPERPRHSLDETAPTAGRSELLAAACRVGDRLVALASRASDAATWLGLGVAGRSHTWSLSPLSTDLYAGLPGVIFFLAYLGRVSGKASYTDTAHAALATLRHQLHKPTSPLRAIGAFEGWGGILYLLTHLSRLWQQPQLLEEARSYLDRLPDLIERDRRLDLMSGAAGCLACLLILHRHAPESGALTLAQACAEHLSTRVHRAEDGKVGWLTPLGGQKPLLGFSHGIAGIAWALLEFAAQTGSDRHRALAIEAIASERSQFCSAEGNWPDLREPGTLGKHSFMVAWCHGAPGIGLARLLCLPHTDDPRMVDEISVAVDTTLRRGWGRSHCLCHGDFGNLELLLQADQLLSTARLRERAYRLAASALASIDACGWLTGLPQAVESPGLMNGIAGIGYGLLRLAAPEEVPSVLTLEAPGQCTPGNGSGALSF